MNENNYSLQDMDALYGTRPALSANQSVSCPEGYEPYTLKTGDTLNSVAQARGITLTELLFYNAGLNPFAYKSGDTICVPEVKTTDAAPAQSAGNSGNTGNNGNGQNGNNGNRDGCVWVCPESPAEGDGTAGCGANTTPYTVVSGDTLRAIAQKFGITLEELVAANPNVAATRLQIGQVLCIPQKESTTENACGTNGTQVTVESGGIVPVLRTYNVSYAALSAANANVELSKVETGQKLCVPASGSRGNCTGGKGSYVVQQDVTLSQLAQTLGVTELALLAANPTYTPDDFGKNAVICLP